VLILGAEPFLNGAASAVRYIDEQGLNNIRMLQGDARDLMAALPDGCLDRAFILFPDPWPKRAHQNRRLVQPEFLSAVHATLIPEGELRLKTDDLPYFRWMEKVISESTGWERHDWADDSNEPLTNFEARFIAQGLPIHKTIVKKTLLSRG
jgi:tRNA (guanine-N7-)-methyltransferase